MFAQTSIENQEPIVQRLWEFLTFKELSAYQLAQMLNYSSSEKISRLFRTEGAKPSCDIIVDISNKFADLNLDWWIRGKGNMLIAESNSIEKVALPKVVVTDDKGKEQIVMMDSKAAAGFPMHIDDSDFYKKLPTLKIPKLNGKSGTHICVQVSGSSMEPTIRAGEYVIGKFEPEPVSGLQKGEVCLIVTNEGVLCKRVSVKDSNLGIIECISDNEAYEAFQLKMNEYLQIYKYVGHLSFDATQTSNDLRSEVNSLAARLNKLEKKINL